MGNNSHQFLGYWGYGSQGELEEVLSKVISRYLSDEKIALTNHQDIKDADCVSSDDNFLHPIWNVAYIGIKSRFSVTLQENGVTQVAALSASGLFTSPDAWVSMRLNDCLILGREPFGRVPLYWFRCGQVIWFASRLQLLLPIVKPEVSIPGLYGYNCFSYVPTPLTPVVDVFAVPAGTEVIWQCDGDSGMLSTAKSQQLWEWREAQEQLKDEATAVVQLQMLLKDAIDRQIASLTDEPVGVFLSGGLDSSIVAALLVQAGVKVRAYTLDFGSAGIPEYPYAEQVAQFLNIPLVKVEATPRCIRKALIPTVQALDLPFGDGVTVPLYLLNQAASQETQVVFNGEGGDQLFAGWTNKPLIAAGVYQLEQPTGQENFQKQYLRTFHRLWGWSALVYQPEIYAQIKNLHPEDWISFALDPAFNTSILHRLRRASLMLKGAQNIHPRATHLGLTHGLLVRSPFCDQHLAEWTFRLSGELCLQGSCEKYILKRSVESWLPPEIVWRQKRGMGVPLTSWCLNDFWHQIGVWLNPGRLRVENRFSPELAAQLVEGMGGGIVGRRIGEILWLLIVWQLWRVHVLGEEVGKHSWDHPFWLPPRLWRSYKQWQM